MIFKTTDLTRKRSSWVNNQIIFTLTLMIGCSFNTFAQQSPGDYWMQRCGDYLANSNGDGSILSTSFSAGNLTARCWIYVNDDSTDPSGQLIFPEGRRGIALHSMGFGPPPKLNNNCSEGNPIKISSGIKEQRENLFSIGANRLDISLFYSSAYKRWQFPFSSRLSYGPRWEEGQWRIPQSWLDRGLVPLDEYTTPGDTILSQPNDLAVYIQKPFGEAYSFYYSDNRWQELYNSYANLSVLYDSDNQYDGWELHLEGKVEVYNTSGLLRSIRYRDGYQVNFSYADLLTSITTTSGEDIQLRYNSYGQLIEVIDPSGLSYLLSYDRANLLSEIIFPDESPQNLTDNDRKQFLYEDNQIGNQGLLTGIIDSNDQRYATWAYDADGRGILSEHHNGADRVRFAYGTDPDTGQRFTTVTNSLLKETTYYFDVFSGREKVTHVEGHASDNCAAANQAYTYDSKGFLESKTDWQGNITTYVHNDRGQELSRTEASGTPQARTITTEWHSEFNLPTKITEPEREIVMTYDSNGHLLSRNIQSRSL